MTLRANNIAMDQLHLERKESKIKKEFEEREKDLRHLEREVEEQAKCLEEEIRKMKEKGNLINSLMCPGGQGGGGHHNKVAIEVSIVPPGTAKTGHSEKAPDRQEDLMENDHDEGKLGHLFLGQNHFFF